MKKILGSMVAVLIILSLVIPASHTVVEASNGFAGGFGTAGDPYQIANWHHLDNVRTHLGDHFILMNDLDVDTDGYDELAGPSADANKGWQPVGDWDSRFTGTFDGRGHEIRDLFIDRPGQDYVGLFGYVGEDGSIKAVGLADVQVTGGRWVGGLVGVNMGTVSDCYAAGTVDGLFENVGGLVGSSFGTVSNCYATGSVNGFERVGGLMGRNHGTVSNCYATGSVTGPGRVGGLVGENDGTVSNCYATGSVIGSHFVGGLVGENPGTVSNSFWDTQTSGMATSAGGTGKTTPEMLCLDTFTDTDTEGLVEAWDMVAVAHGDINPSSIWNIVDGRSYPFFGWLKLRFELKAGWNMVSVPRELPPGKDTVEEVFKGEIEAIYTWNPETKSYTEPTQIEPYRGYWVAVTEDKTIAYLVHA